MLFIKKLKPNLNIQTDSIRAKLFVWYFLTLQFFNQLLLFFSIYRPKITNLFWLDNDVQPTSKRRRFLAIFFNLEMTQLQSLLFVQQMDKIHKPKVLI